MENFPKETLCILQLLLYYLEQHPVQGRLRRVRDLNQRQRMLVTHQEVRVPKRENGCSQTEHRLTIKVHQNLVKKCFHFGIR